MGGSAPDYDNVRMAGPDGIRIPVEAGKVTFEVSSLVTVNGGGTSTYTLSDREMSASILVATKMGSVASIISLPAAAPGQIYLFKNSTGSSSTCTLKVTGGSGVAVADGSHAVLACNATDIERWTADK